MNWKEYENIIFETLKTHYPNLSINRDVKVLGRISNTPRQIDVLIEAQALDSPIRIIVDAKKRKSPIDVNDIESFIAMMNDISAHRGILISTSGYTKAAILRANNEVNQDLELDIFSLEDLKHLQGQLAIPYSGGNGILLPAPFGWVIDAKRREGIVACLYQRGYDFDAAAKAREWMYINFWQKETSDFSLDDLIKIQAENLPDAKITYYQESIRADARVCLRLVEISSYPALEYTGFVEFDDFIFFAVLFTTPEMSKRNLRKLREVLRTVLPIKIKHK